MFRTAFVSIVAIVACAVVLAGRAAAPAANGFPTPPPLPSPRPVTEGFFGTNVTDPYRYFEDMDDPVTVEFFKEQNAYTRAVLDRLGAARQQLFDRIAQLDNAGALRLDVTRDGPYFFYMKLNPGDNSPKLYVRNAEGGSERVLIDPQSSRNRRQALYD